MPRRGRDRRRDDGARAVRVLRVARTREPVLLGLLARPEISCVERADLVVCDLWDHETGHASRPLARALAAGVISRDDVVELPDLVAGRHPGRTTDEQRIFSSPVGLAIEDVAAAARVFRRAEELGIGTRLSLWESPIWV